MHMIHLLFRLQRILSWQLFGFLFNNFRIKFLTKYHCDFSMCNSFKHFDASLLFASSSVSNMINCFFGKMLSFITLPTTALSAASLLPSQHTTDGRDARLAKSETWLEVRSRLVLLLLLEPGPVGDLMFLR